MSVLFRTIALPLSLACAPSLVPLTLNAQTGAPVELITGDDFERIRVIASAYGPAERRTDEADGTSWVRAEMDGIIYTISFLNCEADEACSSVQFRAWWTSEGAHTIEMMNDWNRDRRFSTAYLDQHGNATIEFDVNLAGGVTLVNFDDTVQWWQAVVEQFRDSVIDPAYAASAPAPENAPETTPEAASGLAPAAALAPAPDPLPPKQ